MAGRVSTARPVFVVGSGRCGSTLVSSILRTCPQVLSLSEFFTVLGGAEAFSGSSLDGQELWRRLTIPWSDLRDVLALRVPIPELIGTSHTGGGTPSAPALLVPLPHLSDRPKELLCRLGRWLRPQPSLAPPRLYERLFNWLQGVYHRPLWVERSGGSLHYVQQLREGFPNADFVHVVRDGVSCALSMSKHPFFRIKVARTILRSPRLPVARCLEVDLPLSAFGTYWSALMIRGCRALAPLLPDRLHTLRYDELLSDPAARIRSLGAFLGAGQELDLTAGVSLVRPGRAKPLEAGAIAALTRACAPGERALRSMLHQQPQREVALRP